MATLAPHKQIELSRYYGPIGVPEDIEDPAAWFKAMTALVEHGPSAIPAELRPLFEAECAEKGLDPNYAG